MKEDAHVCEGEEAVERFAVENDGDRLDDAGRVAEGVRRKAIVGGLDGDLSAAVAVAIAVGAATDVDRGGPRVRLSIIPICRSFNKMQHIFFRLSPSVRPQMRRRFTGRAFRFALPWAVFSAVAFTFRSHATPRLMLLRQSELFELCGRGVRRSLRLLRDVDLVRNYLKCAQIITRKKSHIAIHA